MTLRTKLAIYGGTLLVLFAIGCASIGPMHATISLGGTFMVVYLLQRT